MPYHQPDSPQLAMTEMRMENESLKRKIEAIEEANKELTRDNESMKKKLEPVLCSNDKPASTCTRPKRPKIYPNRCGQCQVTYGSKKDENKTEQWTKCQMCDVWCHDSCAVLEGKVDSSGYRCAYCLGEQ